MPRWKRRIVGEPAEPDSVGGGHKSKAEKALSIKLAEERLEWQRMKNERAKKALEAANGQLVNFEEIKREILQCNQIVKQQVLAVIERANLPQEIKMTLRRAMIDALNELAYEPGSRILAEPTSAHEKVTSYKNGLVQ